MDGDAKGFGEKHGLKSRNGVAVKNMNCDWTEKISLLIDGELAREESARVESHLATCAACREAHAGFLRLRHEIRAYEHAPDVLAERRALQNILASGGAQSVAATRAGERKIERAAGQPASVREWHVRDWLSGAFAARRLRPAYAVAALMLLAVAVGLTWFVNSRDDSSRRELASRNGNNAVTQTTPAPVANATRDVATVATPEVVGRQGSENEKGNGRDGGGDATAAGGDVHRSERNINVVAVKKPDAQRRKSNAPRGVEPGRFRDVTGTPPQQETTVASNSGAPSNGAGSDSAPNNSAVSNSAVSDGAARDNAVAAMRRSAGVESLAPEAEAARHVERAQVLLRSFRNARFSSSDASYDAASQRERSRKLLYQNILLRRDAATRGDLPVENLLSRLEPVLLDIANLPDKPSASDVRPIRDRIERKKMVALLQVHTPLASRSAY